MVPVAAVLPGATVMGDVDPVSFATSNTVDPLGPGGAFVNDTVTEVNAADVVNGTNGAMLVTLCNPTNISGD